MIFSFYQLGDKTPEGYDLALNMLNRVQTIWKLKKMHKVEKPSSYIPKDNFSVIPKEERSSNFSIGITKGKINQNNKLSLYKKKNQKAIISEYEWRTLNSRCQNYDPPEVFWAFTIANICFKVSIDSCSEENCLGYKDFTINKLLLKLLELHICKNCENKVLKKYKYQLPEIKKLINILRRPKEYNSIESFKTPELQVLTKQIKRQIQNGNNEIFNNFGIIIVMHFLEDLVPFLEGLITLGAKEESIVLLVKPYPYAQRSRVHSYLYQNHNKIRIEYLDSLPPQKFLLKELTEYCQSKSPIGKLIVIEDGGYVVPFLHREYPGEKFCIGAVEQTTKGLNRDREIKQFYFPILDVAKSKFKDEYESPLVGNAVVSSIQRLMYDRNFFGRKALVVGFGSVGQQVANALKKLNMIVKVLDSKLGRIAAARVRGFEASDSALKLLEDTKLIIGTTGTQSIGRDILNNIKNDTILASTSSDQIEIDIKYLESIAEEKYYQEGLGTFYKRKGESLLLLGDGYPINFYSGSGIPNEAIDPILTQLFIGCVHIALAYKMKGLDPGIRSIMDELNVKYNLLEDFTSEYNS